MTLRRGIWGEEEEGALPACSQWRRGGQSCRANGSQGCFPNLVTSGEPQSERLREIGIARPRPLVRIHS